MTAIIGSKGVNSAQQTSNTTVNEKTNKAKEKYTITPKQWIGGLLASAAVCGGIIFAIKKKPEKITELLENAKNLVTKNSDDVKKAGEKVANEAKNVVDDAQKVTKKAIESVQDIVDDVVSTKIGKHYSVGDFYPGCLQSFQNSIITKADGSKVRNTTGTMFIPQKGDVWFTATDGKVDDIFKFFENKEEKFFNDIDLQKVIQDELDNYKYSAMM